MSLLGQAPMHRRPLLPMARLMWLRMFWLRSSLQSLRHREAQRLRSQWKEQRQLRFRQSPRQMKTRLYRLLSHLMPGRFAAGYHLKMFKTEANQNFQMRFVTQLFLAW